MIKKQIILNMRNYFYKEKVQNMLDYFLDFVLQNTKKL